MTTFFICILRNSLAHWQMIKRTKCSWNSWAMEKGSLDYAKNIVEFGGIPPEIPDTRPSWCKCGVCQLMPTNEENKCCGKIRCLTSYATFRDICIDREVLNMAIRSRCDIRVEEPDYSTNSFRKAAYRQFIIWRYKKLGKGNRKVCPSCVD